MINNTASYSEHEILNPATSVFVSANAGAGKTRLLTHRVLSLLLHGVNPSRILCLTYTNAAAVEMAGRIQSELGRWVIAPEEKLAEILSNLTGKNPDETLLKHARSLFAHVLEAPEGIRIQTIHGFCQSLLRRFPVEAGISPHFTVMDTRTEQELLEEAKSRLFMRAQTEDSQLQETLSMLSRELSFAGFHDVIQEIIDNKRRFVSMSLRPGGLESVLDALRKILKVKANDDKAIIAARHFTYQEQETVRLRAIASLLLQSDTKTDQKMGYELAAWLEKPADVAIQDGAALETYCAAFLTAKGEKLKKIYTKSAKLQEDLAEQLLTEQERVLQYCAAVKSFGVARSTSHLLHLVDALLALYTQLKNAQGFMDYDDLVVTACALLQKTGIAPWILYKLDGGFDHILVDEAQDTSPEQWIIIDLLTQEFFAGKGSVDQVRSLFIVGDEKQSIYSFQGADPAALGQMRRYFMQRIAEALLPVQQVELQYSFRSVSEILKAVDGIFAHPEAREGLTFDHGEMCHIPTRLQHAGLVEMWPLIMPTEDGAFASLSPLTILSRRIADTIKHWLDSGMMLESKGRAVEPGDIMILLRQRGGLADRLIRALKKNNIPVSGQDRMQLNANLAVQDLTALGQCLLLPEDDLSLAALLKSPLFNLSEEDIYALCWQRGPHSVWERLHEHAHQPPFSSALQLLTELRGKVDYLPPFALYSHALDTLGLRKYVLGRMGEDYNDAIDEFLEQTLLYERSHAPSMQGFLHWLSSGNSEIKRDMEQGVNWVRIMTVHGAKGLQAPIVILPDTMEVPTHRNSIIWHKQESELPLPLWSVKRSEEDAISSQVREQDKVAMLAEYRRLLYVALTRAEDRLYICGATGKDNIHPESWYQRIKTGIATMAEPFHWRDNYGEGEGLRIGSVHAGRAVAPVLSSSDKKMNPSGNWDFLKTPSPVEPTPSKPLTPSRLADNQPSADSPLSAAVRFQRGALVHRLLQYLPDMDPNDRYERADFLVGNIGNDAEKKECIGEVMRILQDERFAFLFGPGSYAEVPLAGTITFQGKTVSVTGQIDRLYIGEKEVWIVDFKSNRSPPTSLSAIPAAYIMQIKLYYHLLKEIYPAKKIRCALLWTLGPLMQEVDESYLDETPSSAYI